MTIKSILFIWIIASLHLCACNMKTSEESLKKEADRKVTSETNCNRIINSQFNKALHVAGVPISGTIKKKVQKHQLSLNKVALDTIPLRSATQDIPGVYLSNSIKSKLLNTSEEDMELHAFANNSTN